MNDQSECVYTGGASSDLWQKALDTIASGLLVVLNVQAFFAEAPDLSDESFDVRSFTRQACVLSLLGVGFFAQRFVDHGFQMVSAMRAERAARQAPVPEVVAVEVQRPEIELSENESPDGEVLDIIV